MKIVTFVTQKGGAGKTTLAINCAVAAERAGQRTILFDLDPQGTAEAWFQDREAETPRLVRLTAAELTDALTKAERSGFDVVLIDTPGRDEPATAAAVRVAGFCIVPCRPSPADMKATPPTVATINRLAKPAAFVLTQAPPRGARIREAEVGLGMLGIVSPVRVVSRTAYQDALGVGMGVIEFDPEGKAAQEIIDLWKWIYRKMEKLHRDEEANVA